MMLVCWSGGLDSTTVLYDLAKKHYDDAGSFGLRAITVAHCRVPCQEQQKKARERIKKWFKKKKLVFEHTTVRIDMPYDLDFEPVGGGLSQPGLWLGAACSYLLDGESLYLGYIKEDDLWHRLEDFRKAFTGLVSLKENQTAQLEFPLEHQRKAQVIQKAQDAGFYDLCWYCEGDGSDTFGKNLKKPCGRCIPCLAHRTALWQLKKGFYPKPQYDTLDEKPEPKLGPHNLKPKRKKHADG